MKFFKLLLDHLIHKAKNARVKMVKIDIKKSFLFMFILESLNINIPDDASHHVQFAFGIFILSLICLINFINVVGYLTSRYLVTKYKVETKYPKLIKVIRYYERSSIFLLL